MHDEDGREQALPSGVAITCWRCGLTAVGRARSKGRNVWLCDEHLLEAIRPHGRFKRVPRKGRLRAGQATPSGVPDVKTVWSTPTEDVAKLPQSDA